MAGIKPRNIYDATDIFVDDDDGTAVLSVLTKQDVDLSVLLTPELLERLRLQIAFLKEQSAGPAAQKSKKAPTGRQKS